MKQRKNKKIIFILGGMASTLIGCSVGPEYAPPITEIPCEWHEELPAGGDSQTSPDGVSWWERLNDPVLNYLISTAAEQNLDLKIAAMRVLQARAEAKGKTGDLYPHIDGSVGWGHMQYSKDALVSGLLNSSLPIDARYRDRNFNFFEAGFDVDWEIDLFGMKAHEIAALRAQEQAVEENLCAIWVTLSAEIARNYVELRGLQERLLILRKMILEQEKLIPLTQELYARGMVRDSEVNKAEVECLDLKAQAPLLELGIARAIHRLSILLGYPPGELWECLEEPGCIPTLPDDFPIGVPSELLRRRPDVRKAERELAAATERIGAAIAALFPRFSLKGFLGDITTHSGTIFSPDKVTWFAGPQLLVPIFNSRLILQEVQYNKITTQQALYFYQKTVLEALEEAENAIAAFRLEQQRLKWVENIYVMNEETAHSIEELYARGVHDYATVASAEKGRLVAENNRVMSRVDLLTHYISLYKAVGGTWP